MSASTFGVPICEACMHRLTFIQLKKTSDYYTCIYVRQQKNFASQTGVNSKLQMSLFIAIKEFLVV